MELRHLRYFVAVTESGSLTVAAEKRLFTARPSLSRQLRDLEQEVGAQLFIRGARGIELTPAGRAFLDHARLALGQATEAVAAARRAARPGKQSFSAGFLTGQEVDWLPRVSEILRNDLKNIDLKVTSDFSPDIADAVQRGEIDRLLAHRVTTRRDLSRRRARADCRGPSQRSPPRERGRNRSARAREREVHRLLGHPPRIAGCGGSLFPEAQTEG